MKVVFSGDARRDLGDVLRFIAVQYPTSYIPFERRVYATVRRIGNWPESAQSVLQHPDVRVVPLVRFPYKIFYRVTNGEIEILHIHHTAQQGM